MQLSRKSNLGKQPYKGEFRILIIYGASHLLQSLTGAPDDVHLVWEPKDEVWDTHGLGHSAQVGVANLAASVHRRRFLNFIDTEQRLDHGLRSGRRGEVD